MTTKRLLLTQLQERVKDNDPRSAEHILKIMKAGGYPTSLLRFAQTLIDKEVDRTRNAGPTSPNTILGTITEELPELSEIKIRELKAFGAAILGPCMTLFYRRLATKTSYAHKSPRNLYFLAREGYLMQRGYDNLKISLRAKADSRYLTTSRVLIFRALLEDSRISPLICSHNFIGTLEGLLKSRCGLTQEEVQTLNIDANVFPNGLSNKLELPSDTPKIVQLIEQNANAVKAFSSETRQVYVQYLHELGIMEEETIHIVDLGYSGTIQKSLSILTGKPVVGHYLITTPAARNTRQNKFLGHIFNNISWGAGCSLLDRSLILEALLTAPTGSAQGIKQTPNGIAFTYGPETQSQKLFAFIEYIFAGCLEYCRSNYNHNNCFSPWQVDAMYELATCAKNSTIPAEALSILEVEDSFSGLGIIKTSSIYSN